METITQTEKNDSGPKLDLLPISEAAVALHLHPEYLRELIRRKRVGAHKAGGRWLLPRSEIRRYLGALSTDATLN